MKIPKTIIEQLVNRVSTEKIYQFSYEILGQTYHRLLIVLDSRINAASAGNSDDGTPRFRSMVRQFYGSLHY